MLSKSNRCEAGAISLTLTFHIEILYKGTVSEKKCRFLKLDLFYILKVKKNLKDVKCFLLSLDVTVRFL